jgi:hypothetical protein
LDVKTSILASSQQFIKGNPFVEEKREMEYGHGKKPKNGQASWIANDYQEASIGNFFVFVGGMGC